MREPFLLSDLPSHPYESSSTEMIVERKGAQSERIHIAGTLKTASELLRS